MTFYIATRKRNVPKALELEAELIRRGHKSTSNWLRDITNGTQDCWTRKQIASKDKFDVKSADIIVVLSEDCEGVPGGMWAEMGMGLALNKGLIVIGPKTNVFCHLADEHYDSIEDYVDHGIPYETTLTEPRPAK